MEGVEAKAAQAEAMVATLRERLNTLRALVEKVSALRPVPTSSCGPAAQLPRLACAYDFARQRCIEATAFQAAMSCACATPRHVQCSAVLCSQRTHHTHCLMWTMPCGFRGDCAHEFDLGVVKSSGHSRIQLMNIMNTALLVRKTSCSHCFAHSNHFLLSRSTRTQDEVDKLTAENKKLQSEVNAAKAQLRDIKAKAGRREYS